MNALGFFEFGAYRFDPGHKLLYRNQVLVPTAPKVLQILGILIENHGQLVEKDLLLRAVWPETFVEENNLSQHVSALRKLLAEGGGEAWIETVPRRGFRLVAPVRFVSAPAGGAPRRKVLAGLAAITALAAGGGSLWWSRRAVSAGGRSLIVLPVLNISGDPRQEYLADGMTDGLISDLARVNSLRVVSRTSTMTLKGAGRKLADVARELSVDLVLETSIARSGDRVRIHANLIQARGELTLWSTSDDKDIAEMPAAQMRIAHAIAERLGLQFPFRASGTINRMAYEEYLRGRYAWNKRTPGRIEEAIVHFRNAIDQDPAFAPAYAGLADSYNQMGSVQIGSKSPLETRPLAVAAARKAMEIDDNLPEAHAALGMAVIYDWKWEEAEREYRRALELGPGLAQPRAWYAIYLMARNRMADAIVEVRRAVEQDPLSAPIRGTLVWILGVARSKDEAIREGLRALEISPNDPLTLWRMGMVYTSSGQYEKAIEVLETCASTANRGAVFLDPLGEAYAWSGQRARALAVYEEIASTEVRGYRSPVLGLLTSLGLRRWEQAFRILDRGARERSNYLTFLRVMPPAHMYPEFRGDRRFQQLMRQTGA